MDDVTGSLLRASLERTAGAASKCCCDLVYLAAFINFVKCKQVSVVDGLDMVRRMTLRSGTRRTDTLVALCINLRLLCLRSGTMKSTRDFLTVQAEATIECMVTNGVTTSSSHPRFVALHKLLEVTREAVERLRTEYHRIKAEQLAKGRILSRPGLARPYRGLGILQPKAIENLHRSVLPSDIWPHLPEFTSVFDFLDRTIRFLEYKTDTALKAEPTRKNPAQMGRTSSTQVVPEGSEALPAGHLEEGLDAQFDHADLLLQDAAAWVDQLCHYEEVSHTSSGGVLTRGLSSGGGSHHVVVIPTATEIARDELVESLEEADASLDGNFLDREDLLTLLTTRLNLTLRDPRQDVDTILSAMDLDDNGYVSTQEFLTVFAPILASRKQEGRNMQLYDLLKDEFSKILNQARTEWKLICRKVLLIDSELRIIETDPIYNSVKGWRSTMFWHLYHRPYTVPDKDGRSASEPVLVANRYAHLLERLDRNISGHEHWARNITHHHPDVMGIIPPEQFSVSVLAFMAALRAKLPAAAAFATFLTQNKPTPPIRRLTAKQVPWVTKQFQGGASESLYGADAKPGKLKLSNMRKRPVTASAALNKPSTNNVSLDSSFESLLGKDGPEGFTRTASLEIEHGRNSENRPMKEQGAGKPNGSPPRRKLGIHEMLYGPRPAVWKLRMHTAGGAHSPKISPQGEMGKSEMGAGLRVGGKAPVCGSSPHGSAARPKHSPRSVEFEGAPRRASGVPSPLASRISSPRSGASPMGSGGGGGAARPATRSTPPPHPVSIGISLPF